MGKEYTWPQSLSSPSDTTVPRTLFHPGDRSIASIFSFLSFFTAKGTMKAIELISVTKIFKKINVKVRLASAKKRFIKYLGPRNAMRVFSGQSSIQILYINQPFFLSFFPNLNQPPASWSTGMKLLSYIQINFSLFLSHFPVTEVITLAGNSNKIDINNHDFFLCQCFHNYYFPLSNYQGMLLSYFNRIFRES